MSDQPETVAAGSREFIHLPLAPAPRVSVIIPVSERSDLLSACLRSVARHAPPDILFETIVVLSGSAHAAREELEARVSDVRFAATPVRLGLAGAGNRGRALARGEYLVLLHDDAEVEPGWLEALVEAADSEPAAGAVGGLVLSLDGSLQSAGMILWRDASTSPPWKGAPPSLAAFSARRAVDYCGTASLLVRASTWDAVGGLDERFYPAYYVDVDLALAIRAHGQIVVFEPRSRIRHHRGSSLGRRFAVFASERNRAQLQAKWGAVLEAHEPWAAHLPAGVARAMARAEAFGRQLRLGRRAGERIEARVAETFDGEAQERRLAETERLVSGEFIAALTAELDQSEAELARKRRWRQFISWIRETLRGGRRPEPG